MRYVCTTRCYWGERIWEPGDVYQGKGKPPKKHFQRLAAPKPASTATAPAKDAGEDTKPQKDGPKPASTASGGGQKDK